MRSIMNLDPSNPPDEQTFSKDDIASIVIGYEEKIHYLQERIRLLQNELFGRKSEKHYPDDHRQLLIFDQSSAESNPDGSDIQKTIVVAEHQRAKRGRKPMPDDLPVVTNGLALCKLHHAAFDQSILGIRPDYIVSIRADIRDETDGPMLKHGLQGLHNTRIVIPKSKRQRPAPELLERRWEQFIASA